MSRKTATAKKPAPKRGRPKGSRNTEPPVVEVTPAHCRVAECASTDLEVLKRLPDQHYSGLRDGRPYNRIVRRRVRCRQCGAVTIVKTYEMTAGK